MPIKPKYPIVSDLTVKTNTFSKELVSYPVIFSVTMQRSSAPDASTRFPKIRFPKMTWLCINLCKLLLRSYKNCVTIYLPRFMKTILITGLLIIRGKKSEISRDLKRQIRGENGRFRGIVAGIFGANFRWNATKKAKKKDSWEKYWKDVKFRARKKHKSSSNTVLKATVLVSSDKKNI